MAEKHFFEKKNKLLKVILKSHIFIPFRNKIVLLNLKYVSDFGKITYFTKARKKGTTNKADFAKFRPRIHKLAFVLPKGVHIGQV